MRSLPLFHRIAGRPVIVLGNGPMAEPKRRLVERAGGLVIDEEKAGVQQGARLAFIALESPEDCEKAATRLRDCGVLVNVVDQPDLCEFTTPSILERDPVLLAIGTSGASAGLAKQLRLRLEALLPADLGKLAQLLSDKRKEIRAKFPDGGERRQALDEALGQGGMLDVLDEKSAANFADWIGGRAPQSAQGKVVLYITSDDPEELTLRQFRLMGSADLILYEEGVSSAILDRARADAERIRLGDSEVPKGTQKGLTLILKRQKEA
ncbi:siroheme synthase [Altererythrobacter indicus]|uniref:precorrin-2 dehydrogenase n=1 Tax=Altericroceibacterium indicum TaxID=374177 RepID=A0A845A423_9SPHN|nr:bifunctional precorrin-2 dehydrogenase/sirohydrochlorin ferrochelatase [Altericroceibacterium indicum]MXP24484.1 siroheme synthase [Altericroceibacterium indicum]